MALSRDDINRAAIAVAESMTTAGMPHSIVIMAFRDSGLGDPEAACQALIDLNILTLRLGHLLVEGPMMSAVKRALEAHRAQERTRG